MSELILQHTAFSPIKLQQRQAVAQHIGVGLERLQESLELRFRPQGPQLVKCTKMQLRHENNNTPCGKAPEYGLKSVDDLGLQLGLVEFICLRNHFSNDVLLIACSCKITSAMAA